MYVNMKCNHFIGIATAAVLVLTGSNFFAQAKVAPSTFDDLVKYADLIVIADVIDIHLEKKTAIAEAKITETLKGDSKLTTAYFLASPTWTCDISTANKGENVLLFLNTVKDRSEVNERAKRFERPVQLPNEGYDPLFVLSDFGRGYMPIQAVEGKPHADVYTVEVLLPDSIKQRAFPDEKDWFHTLADLDGLKAQIRNETESKRHTNLETDSQSAASNKSETK